MPLKVLSERYTSSKNSVTILEVKKKELLVIAKLLNIAANGSGEVKGIGNTIYPLGANYVLR